MYGVTVKKIHLSTTIAMHGPCVYCDHHFILISVRNNLVLSNFVVTAAVDKLVQGNEIQHLHIGSHYTISNAVNAY